MPFATFFLDVDAVWIDHGIDGEGLNMSVLRTAHKLRTKERRQATPQHHVQIFGGFAFKYNAPMSPSQISKWAGVATSLFDVVTTSGSGTGHAIDQTKALAVQRALASTEGNAKLGCASGVSVWNIGRLWPLFDAFIVASSVEDGEQYSGILNRGKIGRLVAGLNHGGGSGGSGGGGGSGGSGGGGSGGSGEASESGGETKTSPASPPPSISQRLDESGIPRLWISRHGRKAPFDLSTSDFQWQLRDDDEVSKVAQEVFGSNGAKPRRILASPFHRTVRTACIYAVHAGLNVISIEPGLCEVLTPSLGCRTPASGSQVPTWTLEELERVAAAYGVSIDETYVPVVSADELRMETDAEDRTETRQRIQAFYKARLCPTDRSTTSSDFLVTHERAGKILLRMLQSYEDEDDTHEDDMVVPEGSVTELALSPCNNQWYAMRQTTLIELFLEEGTVAVDFLLEEMKVDVLPFFVDTKWCKIPNPDVDCWFGARLIDQWTDDDLLLQRKTEEIVARIKAAKESFQAAAAALKLYQEAKRKARKAESEAVAAAKQAADVAADVAAAELQRKTEEIVAKIKAAKESLQAAAESARAAEQTAETALRSLVDAMREGASNAGVALYGCGALMNLAINDDNQKKIAQADGIDMILRTMEEHAASNASVALEGCDALWMLACNTDNRKSIADAGGIAMILSVMEKHGAASNADVAQHGCGALWLLSYNNTENKRKIIAANGVSMVERMKSTWASNEGVKQMADGALAILRN